MVDATATAQANNTSVVTNTNIKGVPPPPPRSTGDPQKDLPLLIDWMWRFYSSVVVAQYYLTTSSQQLDTGTFDPSTLPDPATSTIPKAQLTANNAYIAAEAAKTEADKLANWNMGTVQFSDATTAMTVTFASTISMADTNFEVFLTVSGISGTPATNSLFPIGITKTTTGFTATIAAAPGTGNSVTYNYLVVRNI